MDGLTGEELDALLPTEEALQYFTCWATRQWLQIQYGATRLRSLKPGCRGAGGPRAGALDLELEAEKEVAHESHLARPPTGGQNVSTGSDPAARSLISAGLCVSFH